MKRIGKARRYGFTLLELILAIVLSATVMYLLTTAIELYIVREDAQRSRTESAQVARAVLDQIARELATLQAPPPPPAPSPSQGQSARESQSGSGGAGAANAMSSASAGAATSGLVGGAAPQAAPIQLPRLVGSDRELRFNCAAAPSWQRVTTELAPGQSASAASLPRTLRYYVAEGEIDSSQQSAARGVQLDMPGGKMGLVRESLPTAALLDAAEPSPTQSLGDAATAEMLAPEVVEVTFAYFDGSKMFDVWDPSVQTDAPRGIEIRLKVLETSYEAALDPEMQTKFREGRFAERDVAEYRRYVALLPHVSPRPIPALLFPAEVRNE